MGLTRVFLRLTALAVVSHSLCSRRYRFLQPPEQSRALDPGQLRRVCGDRARRRRGRAGRGARALRRSAGSLDELFLAQTRYLDELPLRYVDLAIFGAAALSLFLELAVIRWQGTVFEFFAFYKNFTLLSCFAGLGIGYPLAAKDRTPLPAVVPLLAWQFALLIAFRFGMPEWSLASVRNLPFQEQLNMGVNVLTTFAEGVATYFFLSVAFVLTAHRLRADRAGLRPADEAARQPARVRAESARQPVRRRADVSRELSVDAPDRLVRAVVRGDPFAARQAQRSARRRCAASRSPASSSSRGPSVRCGRRIYSPYQMLELGHTPQGYMEIRAAGHYYQRVFDLSKPEALDTETVRIRNYYDLPYRSTALRRTLQSSAPAAATTSRQRCDRARSSSTRSRSIPRSSPRARRIIPEHPYRSAAGPSDRQRRAERSCGRATGTTT